MDEDNYVVEVWLSEMVYVGTNKETMEYSWEATEDRAVQVLNSPERISRVAYIIRAGLSIDNEVEKWFGSQQEKS